jgi:predicted transcriptional regulator of viral defense system
MDENTSIQKQVLEMAKQSGVIRVRDVIARGIHPEYLRRLCKKGFLVRIGRGMYMATDFDVSSEHSMVESCKRVPQGIICLLSALRFHEIGTQNPHEVWMALPLKARRPKDSYPPLHIVRFSGPAFTEGVEKHRIEGVIVQVYNPAKTVADCFKYRNKIGLDVVLEALKDCLQRNKATIDELWNYAKICRVTKVMKPYMEALV